MHLNRRNFLRTTGSASVAAAGALSFPGGWEVVSASPATPSNGFPEFSWKNVPSGIHVGKYTGDFTPSEASFLGAHSPIVILAAETGVSSNLPADQHFVEVGYYNNARILKAANPGMKVLYYWAWHGGGYRNFQAYSQPDYNPAWLRPQGPAGHLQHDVTNPQFRAWWARAAANIANHPDLDGVFVDGVGVVYVPEESDMLSQLRQNLNASPDPKILLMNVNQNGRITAPPGAAQSKFEIVDGEMIEHYGAFESATPEIMRASLMHVIQLGKAQKIVFFKGWPGFTFQDARTKTMSYAEKVATARHNIVFPLASYLVAADRYCYFQYSWDYNNIGGSYVLESETAPPSQQMVDPTWYPELLRPLGVPHGDATIQGYHFSRTFDHAQVEVDLTNRQASINWT
jgi:hypothetical protein